MASRLDITVVSMARSKNPMLMETFEAKTADAESLP